MGWKVTVPPAAEPLTLAEVKGRLSVSDTYDDADITAGIRAAREHGEQFTGRAFIEREILATWPAFFDELPLPVLPVGQVLEVRYYDPDGVDTVLASGDYLVDDYAPLTRLVPPPGVQWPPVQQRFDAVRVRYQAGYGPDGSDVPEPIRQALMLAVGHWVRFQAQAESGVGPTRMPMQFYDLLGPYKLWRAG